jgi:ribosome-associated translation inhibitor RaiA
MSALSASRSSVRSVSCQPQAPPIDPVMPMANVAVSGHMSPPVAEAVRAPFASLERVVGGSLEAAHVTIGKALPTAQRPYVADARMRFDGRELMAHTTGRTPVEAAEAAADRLRKQVRRVLDADVAGPHERVAIQAALGVLSANRRHRPEGGLKRSAERRIVDRRAMSERAQITLQAAAQLLDADDEFCLFSHARTGEDVVVHRHEDGRLGLLVPLGSALAAENDVVVPCESRYAMPLRLEQAKAELDELDHRFLYFVDHPGGRGKVLYLRHDGDYGLVEPACR